MIIETVEGYTQKEFLNHMFHLEYDVFGEEHWVSDAPIYKKADKFASVHIKITIETVEAK
jgi:hypothetical protein